MIVHAREVVHHDLSGQMQGSAGRIKTTFGKLQSVATDISSDDVHIPAVVIRGKYFAHGHCDRVSFLAGRAPRTPNAQGMQRLAIISARNSRQYVVLEYFKKPCRAEERRVSGQ